jgi:membrane associated rhomboid family serine protease
MGGHAVARPSERRDHAKKMRSWLPQRPLSGPEVVGVIVVALIVLPFLIGGFFALVTAVSTWPAVIGLVAGAVGAMLVQHTLTRQAIYSQQRIAELERENAQLNQQVRQLEATIDQYINHQDEPR